MNLQGDIKMNLPKDRQDNRRLQEIDKAFHLHFGGETNIEDWSLDNFDINTRKVLRKYRDKYFEMLRNEAEYKTELVICDKIDRILMHGIKNNKYTKAWIWSTKL